ncbi:uncharacterized protein LACBIDRAFT_333212 [Laccaria bicolor S238N-H82]|uniref:Predicted protein n=1 Tax=Laccaria bicolor (strain S238N-H82 / ATCC MYA-4686) TaxID=486041 RepID=B0DV94_LACBS|nr:uncharacterized protein LACBIDRAFT_333212 [Laccaria bicolor S238N-H82]EDR01472.1 predicted protein [Laccaria bicolor S238N-H82]|eukprot:XP_001887824.1 predicted protein [Laccaria bicolor S238N-H82]
MFPRRLSRSRRVGLSTSNGAKSRRRIHHTPLRATTRIIQLQPQLRLLCHCKRCRRYKRINQHIHDVHTSQRVFRHSKLSVTNRWSTLHANWAEKSEDGNLRGTSAPSQTTCEKRIQAKDLPVNEDDNDEADKERGADVDDERRRGEEEREWSAGFGSKEPGTEDTTFAYHSKNGSRSRKPQNATRKYQSSPSKSKTPFFNSESGEEMEETFGGHLHPNELTCFGTSDAMLNLQNPDTSRWNFRVCGSSAMKNRGRRTISSLIARKEKVHKDVIAHIWHTANWECKKCVSFANSFQARWIRNWGRGRKLSFHLPLDENDALRMEELRWQFGILEIVDTHS